MLEGLEMIRKLGQQLLLKFGKKFYDTNNWN
jgi:hypothetical protein